MSFRRLLIFCGRPSCKPLLLGIETLHGFLEQVDSSYSEGAAPDSSCGVTVRQDSRPVTLAASDDRICQIDQLQYDLEEGPCLDTPATGKVNYIPTPRSRLGGRCSAAAFTSGVCGRVWRCR